MREKSVRVLQVSGRGKVNSGATNSASLKEGGKKWRGGQDRMNR